MLHSVLLMPRDLGPVDDPPTQAELRQIIEQLLWDVTDERGSVMGGA